MIILKVRSMTRAFQQRVCVFQRYAYNSYKCRAKTDKSQVSRRYDILKYNM